MQKSAIITRTVLILALLLLTPTLFSKDIEFPAIQSFAWFPYEDTEILPKGSNTLSFQTYWSNIYIKDSDYDLYGDMEILSTELTYRRGLTARLTLQFSIKASKIWGGALDGFIEDFHSIFGLRQGGRKEAPRYAMDYRFGERFSYKSSQNIIHPPIISMMFNLFKKERTSLNLVGAVGIPLMSKKGFVSSKPYLTFGPIFNYRKNRFHLSVSTLLALYKRPSHLKESEISSRIFFGELKLRWKTLFAGIIFKTSPWKFTNMDKESLVLYVGVKIFKKIEISIMEEATPPLVTTPDVTFNIRFKHSF